MVSDKDGSWFVYPGCYVLILVLMEYGLWHGLGGPYWCGRPVLILVLMEYGLWPFLLRHALPSRGLNPCSNGIWSLTELIRIASAASGCLNPCSNGIWSLTTFVKNDQASLFGLNPCSNGIWSLTRVARIVRDAAMGLNPCSNGIWSLTIIHIPRHLNPDVLILVLMEYGLWRLWLKKRSARPQVLILVLMEYGLWLHFINVVKSTKDCLNPCSNGIWSLTNYFSI